MRYFYYLILLGAALAYPATRIAAMESPPISIGLATVPVAPELAPAYRALERLLPHYRALALEGGWPAINSSGSKIEPGAVDARIPVIRAILGKMDDNEIDAPPVPEHYDLTLQESVKRFQRRHGLTDDGVIGKGTLQALAVPVEKRLRQIERTLERMAELTALEDRFLIINIPGYMLYAFEDGKKTLDMKVIIGDRKNHTPRFSREIRYVSFNPHWGVPTRIAAEELLPKIAEDPNYIAANDYAIYDTRLESKEEVDPATIDWQTVDKDNFPYFLRQRPGLGNALGKIKFGLVDSNGIYLHSTSAPKLFEKDYRALSHGCIRVEKPQELMHFIFKAGENYDPAKIDARYASDESKILKAPPLMVHTVYWTAWVDENGEANFRQDIYGLD